MASWRLSRSSRREAMAVGPVVVVVVRSKMLFGRQS